MSGSESESRRLPLMQTWLKGMVEVLFYTPILLLVAVFLLPAWSEWSWLLTLPLAYVLSAILAARMPRPRLIVRIACSLAIGILHALCIFAFSGGELIFSLLAGSCIGALIAFRGMSMVLHGWTSTFSNMHMLIGLFLYLAIQPAIFIWLDQLESLKGVLILLGIIAIIVSAFMINERHLHLETHDSVSTSAASGFKRQNRFLLGVLVVLLVLIGLFRSIQQAIEQWVHAWWSRLMSWFDRPQEAPPEEASPPTQPPMEWGNGEAPKPPPAWMEILEQIVKVAVVIVIIAAAAVLLFFLGRKLYQVIKKLANKLLQRGEAVRSEQEEYVDEVESLMSWSKWNKQMRSRLRKMVPGGSSEGTRWEQLTSNADRIRFLYAKQIQDWSRKGDDPKVHLTPRELIHQKTDQLTDSKAKQEYRDFAELYEEVRYGEKQPMDEQVNVSKSLIDKK